MTPINPDAVARDAVVLMASDRAVASDGRLITNAEGFVGIALAIHQCAHAAVAELDRATAAQGFTPTRTDG